MTFNAVGIIVLMSVLSSASCLLFVIFVPDPDHETVLRLLSLAIFSLSMTIVPIYNVSTINLVNHRDQVFMLQESRLRMQQNSLKGDGLTAEDANKMALQLQTLANIIESSDHQKHKLLGVIISPQLVTKFVMAVMSAVASVGFKMIVSTGGGGGD